MKVLVIPHELGIGGSQLNAVELAAGVRDLGAEVVVFGRPGALAPRIAQLGLEFVEAPARGRRPSPAVARAISALVAERGIDIVHGYEWPPVLDAVLAGATSRRAAVVATVMSMAVPPFIPRSVELVVGTEEIATWERRSGRSRVTTIEPPVDLGHNDIAVDPGVAHFRRRHGIDDARVTVVSVSRLVPTLKLEGILTAIDEVAALSEKMPTRLVIVGDGPARDEVARAAAAANARAGAGTVILTGELDDPRPAYAAADIAIGMGGSALRAMAYGKPLIVQGEQGFWETLTPDTLDGFLWTGWYGTGPGPSAGGPALRRRLERLRGDRELRRRLGRFSLETVRERFSVARAATLQQEVYRRAAESPAPVPRLAEGAAMVRYAHYFAGKRLARLAGRELDEDFNVRPVAARAEFAGGRA
jgi:glycosyltransferase involved in cell wall biosynthesis